jgi:hypothetical protein
MDEDTAWLSCATGDLIGSIRSWSAQINAATCGAPEVGLSLWPAAMGMPPCWVPEVGLGL